MDRAVIASEGTIREMQEILRASTRAGREVSGVCVLREATAAERTACALAEGRIEVVEDLRTTVLGDPDRVGIPRAVDGELAFHTHPGLRFGIAGFSEGDRAAVASTGRPLAVLGYTLVAPENLSWLGLAGGWPGLLLTVAAQGALRAEAAGRTDTQLLRYGVVARVLFPSGEEVPVRRDRAGAWARAAESAAFTGDRVVTNASNALRRWTGRGASRR